MKVTTLISAIAITAMSFSAFAQKKVDAAAAKPSPAGKYSLDASHSKVGFEIPHLVISTVEGRFGSFTGEFEMGEKVSSSKVTASVDISSIDTANADRDTHLKSADFFDAAKHPKMTFTSKSITGSFESFKMTGDLTIKGKTKSVVFDGKFLGNVVDGYNNTKAAFTATTKISRKDFGLTWSKAVEAGPVVGDEVTITLKIQGAKNK